MQLRRRAEAADQGPSAHSSELCVRIPRGGGAAGASAFLLPRGKAADDDSTSRDFDLHDNSTGSYLQCGSFTSRGFPGHGGDSVWDAGQGGGG